MSPLRSVPAGDPSPDREGDPTRLADLLVELLARSARGDEAAFAELYDATASRVHGLVLRVLRDPAQSEEVTQEVFLEVWRTASRFQQHRGSAVSWLLTMAHRRAVDRVRSAESASRNETTYHRQNPEVEHDATVEQVEASLEARRVHDALQALTDVQRQALELAYFGGYTHTEVARMLELPVGTAKTRIRDGLIRMRDAMGVAQ